MADEARSLSDEQIAALKSEHGDELRLVRVGGDTVVVKPPTRAVYKRFLDKSGDAKGAERRVALEEIGKACICHPTGAELDAVVEKRAALLTKAAGVALDMAGLGEEVAVEKLLRFSGRRSQTIGPLPRRFVRS